MHVIGASNVYSGPTYRIAEPDQCKNLAEPSLTQFVVVCVHTSFNTWIQVWATETTMLTRPVLCLDGLAAHLLHTTMGPYNLEEIGRRSIDLLHPAGLPIWCLRDRQYYDASVQCC